MSDLKKEDINKLIAEYMGFSSIYQSQGIIREEVKNKDGSYTYKNHSLFTQSLDALIPVIEKLFSGADLCYSESRGWSYQECETAIYGWYKSPSLSLATACYKAIKELEKEVVPSNYLTSHETNWRDC